MAETLSPPEIAREVLSRLAQRHLPPTPDHYHAVYHEISGANQGSASVGTYPAAADSHVESALKDLSAHLLQHTIANLLIDATDLANEAKVLAMKIRSTQESGQLLQLTAKIKEFSHQFDLAADDQAEIRTAMLKLLSLMICNIGELAIEDKWLSGQVDIVAELIEQRPLNIRHLGDAESRMRDLIVKQGRLKQDLSQAQERLKTMLANFVDQLASFTELTSDYYTKIEKCVARITQASTINELSEVLDEAMRETRVIQAQALRTHNDFLALNLRVEESEQEINRLRGELAQASELVRHDPLTNTLNRKGMEEAVAREIARRKRHGGQLSVAMLDIDNFKRFNDILGHSVGDAVLVHLSSVLRNAIRPQDILARYGGEEFFLMLPNTGLEGAEMAMKRVQDELARKAFLHNREKIQITFSCGVSELGLEENVQDAIRRADEAMYQAKRTGKNRVIAAMECPNNSAA